MKLHLLVLLGLFVLDRLSKVLALRQNSPLSNLGFFDMTLNEGLSFSISLPAWLIIIIVSLAILILAIFWYKKIRAESNLVWPLGLIVVGALSNLLDRINYGAVVDFISLFGWTVINVADVYITLGVAWLIIMQLFDKPKEEA